MSKFNWRLRARAHVENDMATVGEEAVEAVEAVEEVEAPKKSNVSDTSGKTQRIRGEVVSVPKVNRNEAGEATSISFEAKVQFKGLLTIKARGDVAAAYWSVTPGMRLAISGHDTADKEFTAASIDVVPVAP